jgi:YHS domain-containing protein
MKNITITLMAFASAAAFAFGAEPAKNYPLDTCVVSGEKLGSMGKPIVHTHEGKQVQFCCKSCLPKFQKDPAKYLKKVDEAKKS